MYSACQHCQDGMAAHPRREGCHVGQSKMNKRRRKSTSLDARASARQYGGDHARVCVRTGGCMSFVHKGSMYLGRCAADNSSDQQRRASGLDGDKGGISLAPILGHPEAKWHKGELMWIVPSTTSSRRRPTAHTV